MARPYRCTNCSGAGHNRLTCPKPLGPPPRKWKPTPGARRYRCTNCDGVGHNAQTCRAAVAE